MHSHKLQRALQHSVRSLLLLSLFYLPVSTTNATANCPASFLTQSVIIFEAIQICATADTPEDKIQHAANVAAAWLDNDLDGRADESKVIKALQQNRATLVMAPDDFTDKQFDALETAFQSGRVLQDLYATETNPGYNRRDASQEELHHLLINAGWMQVYPELFGVSVHQPSALFRQWQQAERQGYYHYDDPSCDDECKAMEFHYLSAAAYLESKADLYSDEMRIKNRTQLRHKLPAIVRLFESNDYSYPHNHWPTGQYAFSAAIKWR